VASLTLPTARSKASSVWPEGDVMPLTLRTYWRAAASISVGVAFGSRPRKTVILRHMRPRYSGQPARLSRLTAGIWPPGYDRSRPGPATSVSRSSGLDFNHFWHFRQRKALLAPKWARSIWRPHEPHFWP
jgi:hypothetical protein